MCLQDPLLPLADGIHNHHFLSQAIYGVDFFLGSPREVTLGSRTSSVRKYEDACGRPFRTLLYGTVAKVVELGRSLVLPLVCPRLVPDTATLNPGYGNKRVYLTMGVEVPWGTRTAALFSKQLGTLLDTLEHETSQMPPEVQFPWLCVTLNSAGSRDTS